jgi:Concanavalin A-like lectin/glucanases superfamily/Repeat of unknown function (DUF5907)/Chaperone of endosialidase
MPATPVRDIELIEVGSLGKETLSNDSFVNLSLGISGATTIPLAATDVTLTEGRDGQAQHFVLIFTGALTANVNVIVPAESRVYVADNRTTGAFTVTCKPATGGGIAVDQGARTLVYSDGLNVYPVASGTGGGGGSGAPTDASYLVGASHSLLSGERVVTDTTSVSWDLTTPGQARAVIPPDAVTYARLQNVTPQRLLGRSTAGAGDCEEISLGTNLTLTGGVLNAASTGGQPLDATLTALAGVTTAANTLTYFTGVDVAASTPLTPLARTLLDDTTQSAMQATLGVVPGTTVQPLDATLTALAGVTTGANMLPFFTGTDLASTTMLTAFMRSLLDDPDAATARSTLGVTGGGGGSSDFLGLTDTPNTYSGQAGKAVLVNAGATALEFGTPAAGATTFLALSDSPDSYAGQAGKLLAVNSGETGTEFVTPAAGGAPTDAEYITSTTNATLSAERVLTDTATITWDRTTAGQIKANASGGSSYTDEQAQDAIGAMLLDTATIDLTYVDATPSLSASVIDASITEAKLGFSDVTTKDASTTTHGLLRKLSGTATEYLNGAGAWATPAGGTNYWSRTAPATNSLATGILAFWPLEEATGNRQDSVGGNHLVPTGTTVQVTNAVGKIGNALAMNGTANTYLSVADNATFSAGPNMSFTVACWVYSATTGGQWGFVGKGAANVSTNFVEYMLWQHSNGWHFGVGNGSSYTAVTSSFAPVANQWCLLIGWYDHVADIQYIQVNNGTPTQVSNTAGSYDSTSPFEVGHTVGVTTGQSLNGRIDMVGFWKRVLTAQERADYWNAGNGFAYPFGTLGALAPATAADRLVLAATSTTEERLEIDGAVKLGTTGGTTDGTLRWTGSDFEGRKGGAWVSMTAGAGGQPLDATLTALAGLATGADQLPYATGTDTFAQTPLTTFARTLLDDTSQAAMRTTLALTPGTDVQAQDAELQAIAGLTSAADRLPYFTGLGTAALATFTAAGRTLAGGADAAAQRGALGLGTMAQQDAASVAITGGGVSNTTAINVTVPIDAYQFRSLNRSGDNISGLYSEIAAAGGTGRWYIYAPGTAPSYFGGAVQVVGNATLGTTIDAAFKLFMSFDRTTNHGLCLRSLGSDTAGTYNVAFKNVAGSDIGTITCTASSTAYNTSSDVRLKHAIAPLTAALERVRALRPIAHRWNADDSPGEGFLAHELMVPCPLAVTGLPDEVNDDGSIKPQQVDHSKLVPLLTAGLQAALAQIDALTARISTLETALGA